MNIPAEFSQRIYNTGIRPHIRDTKLLDEILINYPGSYTDVVYDALRPILVVVFPTEEDCLMFTLQHGKNYV